MAGAGYKLFNTGDVLTAAQVNTYLMEQTVMVFADAAARTTALTGVVSEGMISYLKDTNAVEVYNGSAWVASDDPNAIQNTIVDAKGDLIAASAADTPARLAVGANNTYLIADSAQSTGLAWSTGSYSTYTPGSVSGFTQGNGTLDARYRQFGKTVDYSIKIVLGSTSSITGSLTIQFPVSANTVNNGCYIGNVRFDDTGVASYFGRVYQTGTNFMIAMVEKTDGTYNSQATTSATVPFTWGTNDAIYLMGSYEAA